MRKFSYHEQIARSEVFNWTIGLKYKNGDATDFHFEKRKCGVGGSIYLFCILHIIFHFMFA